MIYISLSFFLLQNRDSPKVPKPPFTFDLLRPSKSSFSVTEDFISCTKVAMEKIQLLRSVSVTIYPFRSL